jgi:uncharacterized protein (DUF362 family)
MKDRRQFLKEAAAGALLMGSQSALGKVAVPEPNTSAGQSRVVVARDPHVYSSPGQLDQNRVMALLDRAVTSWTGQSNPVEAWKLILGKDLGPDKVIGLKTNGLGGKGICTHFALILAVVERLQHAGIKAGNIVIWDRNREDLEVCGLSINTDPSRIRCFGSDIAGYEDASVRWGSANIRLSRILTRVCSMVIGLPILKDHSMSGVTFAMKNMFGVVHWPWQLHGSGCNPGVADLNCIPAIREKVRFTIGDALSSVYDGGPGFHPERLWLPNALIVGEDRVAVDHTAWQMIERKRAEVGIGTLEAAGRPPRYIATAADSAHQLGVNDPTRIHLMEV